MTEHQQASGANTTGYINPIIFMRSGYVHCRMIVEEGGTVDFLHLEVNQSYEKLTGLNIGRRWRFIVSGAYQWNKYYHY